MHRTLDAGEVTGTLRRLHARIVERFEGSGLSRVCGDMMEVANATTAEIEALAQPYVALRAGMAVLLVAALLAARIAVAPNVHLKRFPDATALVGMLESAVNLVIIFGGGIWFLVTLEERLKRARVLAALHELRSLAHVIDMHQLTKDPTLVLGHAGATASSPAREMNAFTLTRCLDYCAEMLALIGKLAALYAERSRDPVVIEAVNDLESLTTNLSRKIWQKISIVGRLDDRPVR